MVKVPVHEDPPTGADSYTFGLVGRRKEQIMLFQQIHAGVYITHAGASDV
jgi:hypothetical protein